MSEAVKNYRNWGRCEGEGCVLHYTPRCLSNLCELCCDKSHSYWLGHKRVDGSPNEMTFKVQKAAREAGQQVVPYDEYPPLPVKALSPPKPPVPEPGKLNDVSKDTVVFVITEDNNYSWSKEKYISAEFPIKYIP